MKPFPSSLKEKKRYLKFKIISEKGIDGTAVKKEMTKEMFRLLGTIGVSETGFKILNFDEKNQTGEIKVDNNSVEKIKACLALIEKIDNSKVIVDIERTSGTLKALRKE